MGSTSWHQAASPVSDRKRGMPGLEHVRTSCKSQTLCLEVIAIVWSATRQPSPCSNAILRVPFRPAIIVRNLSARGAPTAAHSILSAEPSGQENPAQLDRRPKLVFLKAALFLSRPSHAQVVLSEFAREPRRRSDCPTDVCGPLMIWN